jgi:hypothetical protein
MNDIFPLRADSLIIQETFDIIWPAIEGDLAFLKEMNVMDYSLLAGMAVSEFHSLEPIQCRGDEFAYDLTSHIYPSKKVCVIAPL